MFSIDKVVDEIAAGDDNLKAWAQKQGTDFFLMTDANIAAQFSKVSEWVKSQNYEPVAINTFLQVAHYYLVAHALAGKCVVVTHEVPSDSTRRIKLPNVYAGLGLRCMNPYEMLRRENARFVLGGERMSAKGKKPVVPRLRFAEFLNEEAWSERKLGEIGNFVSGGTPSTSNPEYWGGNIQWYTPKEIKNRMLKPSMRAYRKKDLKNRLQNYCQEARFFAGLSELEMDTRIRPLLQRYADFDFKIDTDAWTVAFEREIDQDGATERVEHIKISRGEENTFIWCFFLAIAQLAVDQQEAYQWVKYLYIDDPISSLDDNNAIAVAAHLARMLKDQDTIKAVISSHHTLFFNVM